MNRKTLLNSVCAASALLACADIAAAQEADAPRSVDELVVTAQRREQNLQDVPIVVTSVNAQQLQDAGVRDIKDLTIVAPGLTVTTTSNAAITSARIRGVGTVGDNLGLESSVGLVIDNVYRPRNGVGFGDLGEMERIEILKGPQGTLFGKNTSAGVINILTKRPSFELAAASEATVSNYEGFGASGSLNGPIVDGLLAGRIYVAGRARDGYYARVGPDTNDQNFYTARGQLLATPSETLDVLLAIDYTHRNERCCGSVQISNAAGPTAVLNAISPGAIANPPNPGAFRDYGNRSDLKRIEDKGYSVEVNWETPYLDNATLTSITAGRDWKQRGGADIDWTGADILYAPGFEDGVPPYSQFRQFSQELRLAGDTDRLNWLVGAFFSRELLSTRSRTITFGNQFEQYLNGLLGGGLPLLTGRPANNTTFVPGRGQNDFYKQDGRSQAIFTNNSLKITEGLELTVGLRYTWEKKDLDTFWANTDGGISCATAVARAQAVGAATPSAALVQANGLLGAGPYAFICNNANNPTFSGRRNQQSLKENELTGTAKLAYRFSPEVLVYGSYARGYKAGGFNLDRIAVGTQAVAGVPNQPILDTRFAAELVDSYELGIKNTLLDRSLLLNATVFYQDYKDFQLNAFNGLVFTVSSVPEVVSRGVDLDFVYFTPVEGLSLNGGVTYAETFYGKQTPLTLGPRFRGSRLSLAPLWSASTAVTYERDIGESLMARASINGKWVSSYNTGSDLAPIKNQNGFGVVNARIALGARDEGWLVEAFAQNLLDEEYYQVAFDAPFQPGAFNAFLGQPRTYGLTLRFQY